MIQTLVDWLVTAIETLGYPGVAVAVFLESFFAPIPSELILPFSGFVASTGSLNIYLVILIATFAAYLGSLPFYLLGRWGKRYVYLFLEKVGKYLFISQEDVDRVFVLFNRHGNKLVLFGRLVPIVRTLISFPAGVADMNFMLFSAYTLLGSLLWNILLTYAGFVLGDNWGVVGEWLSKYETVIIVVFVLAVVLYVARGIYKRVNRVES